MLIEAMELILGQVGRGSLAIIIVHEQRPKCKDLPFVSPFTWEE